METPITKDYEPIPIKLRQLIYWRDDYTCQNCGIKGKPGKCHGDIQVHHKIPYRSGGSHNPENIITLCVKCHKSADREWARLSSAWTRYKNNDNSLSYIEEYLDSNNDLPDWLNYTVDSETEGNEELLDWLRV